MKRQASIPASSSSQFFNGCNRQKLSGWAFQTQAIPDNQAAQNPFYNECLIFEILSILKHPA
jgi:hypothetical protein